MTANDAEHASARTDDLLGLIDRRLAAYGALPALRREAQPAVELSYAELRRRIAARTESLIAAGLGPDARIALLCENRPAWVIGFLAALHAGATVVPLDPKLGDGELAVLLAHARPRLVLVSEAQRARVSGARVVTIDGDDAAVPGLPLRTAPHHSLSRDRDEPALIIYTSGTTGDPKGVTITHGNLLHQVRAVGASLGACGRERFLSILPLCHLYELICGLLVPLTRGATISYPASESLLPAELTGLLKQRRITSLVGVPLLYRALARAIDVELRRGSRPARRYVAAAGAVAARLPWRALRRLLHRPLLARLGGGLRRLYCGGAPLDVEVAQRFATMGLPIFDGYGLTETSPVIAANSARHHRIGAVGRPIDGVEVRISADGEILTRGPHVMRGYVDRPDLTAAVLDGDGWLHTGDLGHLDDDGYLYVTGRAKDLIVLGGGKKVFPDEVEQVLAASPGFAEVCVLGVKARLGHDEVCAVVVPAGDREPDGKAIGFAEDEIARMLSGIAAFKRPTRVVVRHEPIPRTTTRKARRAALATWIHTLDRQEAA